MRTCERCGQTAPIDFAFCPACGAPSQDGSTAEARRTVTILFSDIVGSTEIGERLDPERLQTVLGRYFETMRTVIASHGGTVQKYIGDAIMAVFGIPQLREDDALRAVRAAAEMQGALVDLNAELRSHGVEIRARTGVNTGEVIVSGSLPDELLASGDPVNVAARLEQVAGPGEIVIGDPTYRLVRDAVLADPIELGLKGKSEPHRAYRVLEVDPAAAGFARRLDAPMVGRERELSLLRGAFDRAVTDHACHLFTVLGVGGVGKSRLVAAFVDGLGERATVLQGRCLAYGDGITFLPIVEVVRQAAGLTGREVPTDARDRIAALLGEEDDTARIAERIAQIMGIAGGEATPEETLWAIRRLLEQIARARPVVLLIDDIQWAESTLLQLIEYIADWSVDSPILLVCMARPELLDVRPGWGGGKLNATSISLEPLSDEECALLVASLLSAEPVDADVQARVASAAEGHPLFAEELLGMLVDEGRVQLVDGVWRSAASDGELAVPPTTAALLAARIDHLGTAERRLLERASVMGQVFYLNALAILVDEGFLETPVASLMRTQFIRPERSDIAGTDALAFRHLLIRDVAYDGLTKSARADLHRRFADWLRAHAPERDELIGYHYERAVRYLEEIGSGDPAAVAALAAAHLRAAGDQAFARGDMPATENLLTRGAALVPPDDVSLVPILSRLMHALMERGAIADATAVAERAIHVADSSGNEVLAARTLAQSSLARFWGHQAEDDETIVREARDRLPLFEREDDAEGAAYSWAVIGAARWSACRAAEAGAAWRRTVDLFAAAGDRWNTGEYLGWLSSVAVWGPTPCDQALHELAALAREASGIPSAEFEVETSVGLIHMMVGDLDGARRRFLASDRRMRELGRTLSLAHSSQQLGLLELLSGRPEEAEAILGPSAQQLESMGSDALSIISAFRSQALYALGRYDEADQAALTAGRFEDRSSRVIGLGVRAMVAARRGLPDEAEALARDAVATIDETDFTVDRADARIALAEVLELAGRLDDAAVEARAALAQYEEKGDTLQAGHARARLDRLISAAPG